MNIAWLVLLLPLCAFVVIPFVPEKYREAAGWIALLAILSSFVLSARLAFPFFTNEHANGYEVTLPWITLSKLSLGVGLVIDRLSTMMLLVVTGVGSAIFFYSLEYMSHDASYRRYFAGLSLFSFSMIGIVVSNNLLQLFIFWELVGLSSYLLIGHWYQKLEAADAGKKAFLTNRVGDFGFLIGILLIWVASSPGGEAARTLNIEKLSDIIPIYVQSGVVSQLWITGGMLLIFLGVMGKSAQFPLHVWLPDAMEGPTPVSALIHAATMVAAGVYLLARTFVLFSAAPVALEIIAHLGAFTALFAATLAIVQTDIKRVLAYSTLSQLGYMVMAIGLGSVTAGMYHLTTHAFFKALLFLAAGSVIHATGTQDLHKMGGLFRRMPITSATFFIGTFALVGFWPAAGFWSKDEILALALSQNSILFFVATFTVFLTALYMSRVLKLAFTGKPKRQKKLHEPSHKMWFPLVFLSVLSLMGGYLGLEKMFHHPLDAHFTMNQFAVVASTAMALVGVLAAVFFYSESGAAWRASSTTRFAWVRNILLRNYYLDDAYDWILKNVQAPIAEFMNWFEQRVVVEGAVNRSAHLTQLAGFILRKLQNGEVRVYLLLVSTGVVALLYVVVTKTLA